MYLVDSFLFILTIYVVPVTQSVQPIGGLIQSTTFVIFLHLIKDSLNTAFCKSSRLDNLTVLNRENVVALHLIGGCASKLLMNARWIDNRGSRPEKSIPQTCLT